MLSIPSAASNRATSFVLEELIALASALIGGMRYGVKIRLPHAVVMTFLFRKDLSPKKKIQMIVRLVVEHASNLAAFASIYKFSLAVLKCSSRSIRQGVGLEENGKRSISHGIKQLGKMLILLIVDGPFGSFDSCNKHTSVSRAIKAGEPERPYHSLLAGATGGYIVWGRYSSVNYQIVLYLASRILVGLTKRGWELVYKRPGHFKSKSNSNPNSILQHPQIYRVLTATVWGIVMLLFEESPHVLQRSLKKSMDEIYRQ